LCLYRTVLLIIIQVIADASFHFTNKFSSGAVFHISVGNSIIESKYFQSYSLIGKSFHLQYNTQSNRIKGISVFSALELISVIEVLISSLKNTMSLILFDDIISIVELDRVSQCVI